MQNWAHGYDTVEFLGSGDFFYIHVLHNYESMCFVMRVDNKKHIFFTLQYKYMRILQSKFAEANPQTFKKGEGRTLIRHCRVKLTKCQITVESHCG